MDPFALYFRLEAPLLQSRRLTLDGLLAAVIYQDTNDLVRAHRDIPLKKVRSVWAGSCALTETPAPATKVAITQSIRAGKDLTYDMVHGRRGRRPAKIYSGQGDYRNRQTAYLANHTPGVWFSGAGDLGQIETLVAKVTGIGAKRTSGYGMVSGYELIQTDQMNAGIDFADGSPARPVPEEEWGGGECLVDQERWQPPYWKGEMRRCALPSHSIVNPAFAEQLVGV